MYTYNMYSCLEKCPHFAVIADEVSSHGQEILSVCLRLLEIDSTNFQKKPVKHECLLDFHFLERITGEYIANSILDVLNKHKIEVKNCKRQAYDTTASSRLPVYKLILRKQHLMLTSKGAVYIV